MKMKKGAALLLVSAAMVSLAGCGGNSETSGNTASNTSGGNGDLPVLRVSCNADYYQPSYLLYSEEWIG